VAFRHSCQIIIPLTVTQFVIFHVAFRHSCRIIIALTVTSMILSQI
jgi:hypothetical protein